MIILNIINTTVQTKTNSGYVTVYFNDNKIL